MQTLRWLRVPGDTIFFCGAVALVLFVVGLKTGHSFQRKGPEPAPLPDSKLDAVAPAPP
jgi:nitric oxide reductase subunit B